MHPIRLVLLTIVAGLSLGIGAILIEDRLTRPPTLQDRKPIAAFVKPTTEPLDRSLSVEERHKIMSLVLAGFFDPDAALFRWPPKSDFRDKIGDGGYCGLVNGKNRFGGYVGYRPFMVVLTPGPDTKMEPIKPVVASEEIAPVLYAACEIMGYKLRELM